MGVSSITPILPLVASTFDITVGRAALLITVYTLPGMLLTPVLGMLADMIGRKTVLVPSMLLFGIAGFACSFAATYEQLILFRFIQGVGSAAIGALNVTMVGDIFSGNQRAEAMGYNSAVLSIGATLYPVIGGALAVFAWYAPFYLPLLAIPVAFLILFYLKNPEPEKKSDVGAYLKKVLLNLRNKRLLLLFTATLASFLLLYGPILTMIPFLIEARFTESSFLIGLLLSSVSISNGLTAVNAGRLTRRFRSESLVRFSFGLYAAALFMMPFAPSLLWLSIPVILYGVGQGMNLPILITMIAGEAALENRGAIMSLNGMVIKIAQTVAPVAMSLIFAFYGFGGVFTISALLAVLLLLLLIFKLR